MRREIEGLIKKNIHGCLTSYVFIDYLFSSLPLPNANCFMSKDFCQTKKIGTTDYADYTDFFKFFLSVISVLSVATKNGKEILCLNYSKN